MARKVGHGDGDDYVGGDDLKIPGKLVAAHFLRQPVAPRGPLVWALTVHPATRLRPGLQPGP